MSTVDRRLPCMPARHKLCAKESAAARTLREQVADEVQQVLADVEAEDSLMTADRLVGAVRAGRLGVAGLEETRAALEHRQVDELVLDPAAELDDAVRRELVRQAQLTGATVEVVERHKHQQRLGGVGALLRFRHD